MIGLGKENNGLYLVQDLDSRTATSALATAISHISPSDLWHHRLGHPSFKTSFVETSYTVWCFQ